jgi:hypothetical protein
MSQNSLVVPNGTGAAVRAALNNGLNTLVTNNSGTSAPSTTYAYMLWADTTNDLLKIRNAANSAWITVGRLSLTNLGLSAIPRGDLWGMTLSNNGTDAVNDIDVAAGSCASDDAVDANRVLLNPGQMTKQLDAVWAAGSAAGGRISSEALANGTWHVYAFRRSGGTDDYCFSQSLTPTLPDGGTNKRRIGSILRESAAIVAFVQDGDLFLRKAAVNDVSANNPGSSAVLRTLSVPAGLSVIARLNVGLSIGSSVSQNQAYVSCPDVDDQTPAHTTTPGCSVGIIVSAGVGIQAGPLEVRTNTSRQVRSRLAGSDAGTTLYLNTLGWIDTRGRLN